VLHCPALVYAWTCHPSMHYVCDTCLGSRRPATGGSQYTRNACIQGSHGRWPRPDAHVHTYYTWSGKRSSELIKTVHAQVVLVGAGMDTRAWRLKLWPGVCWFEVDHQRVLDAKLNEMWGAGAQTSHLCDDDTRKHHLACSQYHPVGAPAPPALCHSCLSVDETGCLCGHSAHGSVESACKDDVQH
jgi:hypothetical protein